MTTDKWMGMLIEEMTRDELVVALGLASEAYWGLSALYYKQCNAIKPLMNRALMVSNDLNKLSRDLRELYLGLDEAAEQFKNVGGRWRKASSTID